MRNEIRCFISYTWAGSQDQLARRLFSRLKRFHGIAPWIDTGEIHVGQHLFRRIEAGLRNETDCVVCLLSPEYLKGPTARRELSLAAELCYRDSKPLFPIVIKPMDNIPFELGDLLWRDYSGVVRDNGSINKPQFDCLVRELAKAIRDRFQPRPDLLAFFEPNNANPLYLFSNRGYATPYVTDGYSTTEEFNRRLSGILDVIARRRPSFRWKMRQSDYTTPERLYEMIQAPVNLVSYASSKINRCTALMLESLERQFGLQLRFVEQEALRAGRTTSRLPDLSPKTRVGLLVDGQRFFYENDLDHGIVVRTEIPGRNRKTWWILAGCGRAGSVAAVRLLLDEGWMEYLWRDLAIKGPDSNFIAVFSVPYLRETSDQPERPVAFNTLQLSRRFQKTVPEGTGE